MSQRHAEKKDCRKSGTFVDFNVHFAFFIFRILHIFAVYLIYAETPRQREPRDAATDAETCTISDSIDRSLTCDTCDCDYCDYYDAERLMMIVI